MPVQQGLAMGNADVLPITKFGERCMVAIGDSAAAVTVFPDTPELRRMLARDVVVPTTMAEARASPLAHKWLAAVAVEEAQMITMGVMVRVQEEDVPRYPRPIPAKVVFACKANADGSILKFKARLVAKGFRQKEGRDFTETYAPVTSMISVKTLITIAVSLGLHIFGSDVTAAFLQSMLDEVLYLEFDGAVYLLYKTLYGLRQSAYMWNTDLDAEMKRLGFNRSTADPCLYTRCDDAGWIIIVVWVDDMIGASSTADLRDEFLSDFRYDFGSISKELDWVLKIKIERRGPLLAMSQTVYIEGLAEKFGVKSANPKYTPMECDASIFTKAQCPEIGSDEWHTMQKVGYRRLLGCLLYACEIRGDIAFAVNKLSRFASNPAMVHWKALKRVLVYLYTTRTRRLVFGRTNAIDTDNPITVYMDADHAGCKDTARSTSGLVIQVFGSTVFTKAKRQGKVANSTGAAELHAMADAVRRLESYRIIVEDMGFYQRTIPFYSDSQVAIDMVKRGHLSTATKHLRISYFTVLEATRAGDISLHHVPGEDNVSDILTKSLPRTTHEKHTDGLLQDAGLRGFWD